MAAYPYVHHHKKVKNHMKEKRADAEYLAELEPWYPELNQAKYEGKVDARPFHEEPHRLAIVLHDHDPVVHLPGHEDNIEAEGVEALCRRIDDV